MWFWLDCWQHNSTTSLQIMSVENMIESGGKQVKNRRSGPNLPRFTKIHETEVSQYRLIFHLSM